MMQKKVFLQNSLSWLLNWNYFIPVKVFYCTAWPWLGLSWPVFANACSIYLDSKILILCWSLVPLHSQLWKSLFAYNTSFKHFYTSQARTLRTPENEPKVFLSRCMKATGDLEGVSVALGDIYLVQVTLILVITLRKRIHIHIALQQMELLLSKLTQSNWPHPSWLIRHCSFGNHAR